MLEFTDKKKIKIKDDYYSNGSGEAIERSYEELRKGTQDWIDGLNDGDVKDFHQKRFKEDEITAIYEIYEVEQGFTIDELDEYSSIVEFCNEQKFMKFANKVFDESVKDRILYMANRAEAKNLYVNLQEVLSPAFRYSTDFTKFLNDSSVHNIPENSFINMNFDFHELMDKYRYPREITYEIVEGKLDYTDEELSQLPKEEKTLLKLDYYSNGVKVGGGELCYMNAYGGGMQFDCYSYDLEGNQFYISSEANESKQTFKDALYTFQAYAEEGMATSIFRENDEQSRCQIDMDTFINHSFAEKRENILNEKSVAELAACLDADGSEIQKSQSPNIKL